ncbi:hypothetical protein [Cellulomonas sp. URHD0024]|uniref:hypothetical protein n=1 Tax=Cellulomonas sp. URHD0024 TaxID=1302620 RepID=UPI00042626EE|nr:hypothetical protein [Cellulomonas sp. URHD0024]
MVDAALRRTAHLQTVVEFDMGSNPADAPELGERTAHVRRILGISGAVLMAGAIGVGVASGPERTSEGTEVERPAAQVSPCRPVGAPPPGPDEPRAWCSWPVPASASDEIAMREASDAAVARARAFSEKLSVHDRQTAPSTQVMSPVLGSAPVGP